MRGERHAKERGRLPVAWTRSALLAATTAVMPRCRHSASASGSGWHDLFISRSIRSTSFLNAANLLRLLPLIIVDVEVNFGGALHSSALSRRHKFGNLVHMYTGAQCNQPNEAGHSITSFDTTFVTAHERSLTSNWLREPGNSTRARGWRSRHARLL